MSDLAIHVEGLGKRYRIGQRVGYHRLTETLTRALAAPFRKRIAPEGDGHFWALKDVSFSVKPGEVLGIIGRNGAGKSTLLKILSRVTEMTTGHVDLYGRIGSLLEVGTGFHPELTGRENIYLNGAILGMQRPEIRRRFDEIVAFAEVDQFLDTPVKHYSSGMYMRLAFAVAAHLEPEILIVDEVLAVGDAAFQAKCMDKMGAVAKGGRTILFVTHNMSAVERLCTSAMVLDRGGLLCAGEPAYAIARYLGSGRQISYHWQRAAPPPDHPHFLDAYLCNQDGTPCTCPTTAAQLGLRLRFALPHRRENLVAAVGLFNEVGHPIMSSSPLDVDRPLPCAPGVYETIMLFPPALFLNKRYACCLSLYDRFTTFDHAADALVFNVQTTASFGDKVPTGRIGDVQLQCAWSAMAPVGPEVPDAR